MTTRREALEMIAGAFGIAMVPAAAKMLSQTSEEDALVKEIGDNIENAINEGNRHSRLPLDTSKEIFTVGYPIGRIKEYPSQFCLQHKHLTVRLRERFPEVSIVVYANYNHMSCDELIVVRDGEHGGIYITNWKVKPLGERLGQSYERWEIHG